MWTTQRIIRPLKLTRFLCSEKENTVFTDPKDRQVKYLPLMSRTRQTGGQTGSSVQDQMLQLTGFLHW